MRVFTVSLTLSTLLLSSPAIFAADGSTPAAPGFDRPGLLFATDTTPEGHFIFEQGLPDIVMNSNGNVDVLGYSFNSQLRYGFAPDWEVQAGMAPLASIHVDTPAGDSSETGYGDLRVGVKHTLPATIGDALGGAEVAILGGVTLPTGDDQFTADNESIDLGVTALWGIGNGRSAGVLAQLTSGNEDTLLLAGAYNGTLNSNTSYYLEAGITTGDSDGTVVGSGIAWMPWWNVQLDVYLLAGVSGDAPDMQAGFGVSVYFD